MKEKLGNPYFNARRVWNDHVGQVVAAIKTWKIIAIISLVIAAISLTGVVTLSTRSRFVPYVIEIDKLGQVAAIQTASELTSKTLDSVKKAMLSSWISKARLVTPDQHLQAQSIRSVYALLNANDPSTAKMHDWYNADPPFKRAEKAVVNAEIASIIQQSPETYQVDWLETARSRTGELESTANYRALITIYTVPASTSEESAIRANPIGLFVKDFSWSKVSQ